MALMHSILVRYKTWILYWLVPQCCYGYFVAGWLDVYSTGFCQRGAATLAIGCSGLRGSRPTWADQPASLLSELRIEDGDCVLLLLCPSGPALPCLQYSVLIINTMVADDLAMASPGHQQPWYWPSSFGIFRFLTGALFCRWRCAVRAAARVAVAGDAAGAGERGTRGHSAAATLPHAVGSLLHSNPRKRTSRTATETLSCVLGAGSAERDTLLLCWLP